MTWLGVVAAGTMIVGFASFAVLDLLGISLRSQGNQTTRQSWNRRMLALGSGGLVTAILLPFVFVGAFAGLVFVAGWIAAVLSQSLNSLSADNKMLNSTSGYV